MAFLLLDAATATGPSATQVVRRIVRDHTVQAIITGSPTAVTVDLEGSLDGNTWFTLATHPFTAGELTAEAAMFHVTDKAVGRVRINLITLTGGTSPTVTGLYEEYPDR